MNTVKILRYYHVPVSHEWQVRRVTQVNDGPEQDGGLYCTCTNERDAQDEVRCLMRLHDPNIGVLPLDGNGPPKEGVKA